MWEDAALRKCTEEINFSSFFLKKKYARKIGLIVQTNILTKIRPKLNGRYSIDFQSMRFLPLLKIYEY